MLTWVNQDWFFMYFFLSNFILLYLMGSELRYIVCPFLKKIIFSHIILITFLFKFDQFTIVSSFFFFV
jgi:hypothetical protein